MTSAAGLRLVQPRPRPSARGTPGTAAACRSRAPDRGLPAARESLATSSTTSPRRLMMTRRLPGLPAEPALLRELDALLPDVAIAGEADDLAQSPRRPGNSAGIRSRRESRRSSARQSRARPPAARSAVCEIREVARPAPSFCCERLQAASPARARAPAAAAGVASNLSGNAHTAFTGVLIASGSPKRSTMRPRCAGTSMLAAVARAALLLQELVVDPIADRASDRAVRRTAAASTPKTSGARKRGSVGAAGALRR